MWVGVDIKFCVLSGLQGDAALKGVAWRKVLSLKQLGINIYLAGQVIGTI